MLVASRRRGISAGVYLLGLEMPAKHRHDSEVRAPPVFLHLVIQQLHLPHYEPPACAFCSFFALLRSITLSGICIPVHCSNCLSFLSSIIAKSLLHGRIIQRKHGIQNELIIDLQYTGRRSMSVSLSSCRDQVLSLEENVRGEYLHLSYSSASLADLYGFTLRLRRSYPLE
jgi:hypothetical protein